MAGTTVIQSKEWLHSPPSATEFIAADNDEQTSVTINQNYEAAQASMEIQPHGKMLQHMSYSLNS